LKKKKSNTHEGQQGGEYGKLEKTVKKLINTGKRSGDSYVPWGYVTFMEKVKLTSRKTHSQESAGAETKFMHGIYFAIGKGGREGY